MYDIYCQALKKARPPSEREKSEREIRLTKQDKLEVSIDNAQY